MLWSNIRRLATSLLRSYLARNDMVLIFFLYHLEPKRIRTILIINFDGVVPVYPCPAFDGRDNCRLAANGYFILHRAGKFTADDAFVDKLVTFFQLSLCMPLRHACGCPCTAGRTVYRFVAVKDSIAGCSVVRQGFTGPQNMRTAVDGGVFGVDKCVFFVYHLSQHPAPGDQLIGRIIFKPAEIFLRINDGIEVTAVANIES